MSSRAIVAAAALLAISACRGLGSPPVDLVPLGEFRYAALRHLPPLSVGVGLSLGGDESAGYVQTEPLEARMRKELEGCGVTVRDQPEAPFATLQAVIAVRRAGGRFAYSVQLELSENVTLERPGRRESTGGGTWSEERLATSRLSVEDLNSGLQRVVSSMMGTFCQEAKTARAKD